MFRGSRHVRAALLMTVGLLAGACGRDHGPLLAGPVQPHGPPPSSPAAIVRLEIGAPSRIAPGESVQLTATFVKSDGSREDAGDRVGWLVDLPVLIVGHGGLARGVLPGEAVVTVVFESLAAAVRVPVLPPGTFNLSGVVTQGGFGIGNVTLTILSGGDLTAPTQPDGRYAIHGVAGTVHVRARKSGYMDRTATVVVGDDVSLDFELEPDLSTTSGVYTLTVTAGSCDSGVWTLPAVARSRTYIAHVVEEPDPWGWMQATLGEADFVTVGINGNRLEGFRDRQDVRISFPQVESDYGFSEYALLERLGPDTALAIVGQVDTTRTPSTIEGRLRGSLLLIRNPPHGRVEARCDSSSHDFEMRRR